MRLGMFDPPELDPYSRISGSELDSPEHRALARKIANESMVLLKNDGVLPIKNLGTNILVVGPLAEQGRVLLGNYNGQPSHTVTILEGIKKEFVGANVTFSPGTMFLSREAAPVPASALSVDGKPGVKVDFGQMDMSDINHPKRTAAFASRVDPVVDLSVAPLPDGAKGVRQLSVQWTADLTAPETGDYNLGLVSSGSFRIRLNGKSVTSAWDSNGAESRVGRVHLEAGKPEKLEVTYSPNENGESVAKLVWVKLDLKPQPEAIEAARKADVVVAVVGITSELEGEEMQVEEPGFKGGDRTSLDLPAPEEQLIEALAATGKPLVVVLTNGSALGVNWANEHANAIVEAWYPGEEGGTAVAETLSGANNPGGRLPVTFYKDVAQLPAFEDYAMKGRTYRYFEGKPLYPFGYGLSYTTFGYRDLKLPGGPLAAGDDLQASVTVSNTGKVAGDEVVQLYLNFPGVAGAPNKALRGFKRVHLEAGASQEVQFDLKPRDLSIVTDAGVPEVPAGEFTVSVGGGQPGMGAPAVAGAFKVGETQTLPE
jgi:beta-glucosidase